MQSVATTAVPPRAEFEVIVQFVATAVEPPSAATAPPREPAEFEVVAQSAVVAVVPSRAYIAPPVSTRLFDTRVEYICSSLQALTKRAPPWGHF